MSDFLLIENRGTLGTDLLSIVGASTARGNDEAIGQFGSGFKFSVALLLRNSLNLVLCIGKNVYHFEIDERETHDVRGETKYIREVVMKQVAGSSRKRKPMGFDVSFGAVDWHETSMGIREFISNAADASMALQNDHKGVRCEIIDEPGKWARDGFTRVFIQADSEVRKYHKELNKNFLIFNKNWTAKQSIIEKEVEDNLRIYRKGVIVGVFEEKSLFDYNINDIEVKESRIVSEYTARNAVAKELKFAQPKHLAKVLSAIADEREVFEVQQVDHRYMQDWHYDDDATKILKPRWEEAVVEAYGDRVICSSVHESQQVERKGFDSIILPDVVRKTLQSYNVGKQAADVLDHFEVNGREKIELGKEQKERVEKLWKILEKHGMTKNKTMPAVHGFHDVTDANETLMGYYSGETNSIGMNSETFDSPFAFTQTFLEEAAHYVTKSADFTRDLQNWMTKVATLMILEKE